MSNTPEQQPNPGRKLPPYTKASMWIIGIASGVGAVTGIGWHLASGDASAFSGPINDYQYEQTHPGHYQATPDSITTTAQLHADQVSFNNDELWVHLLGDITLGAIAVDGLVVGAEALRARLSQ